jgi:hypothetical protein
VSLQYPLINGHTYSFTSIELTVDDTVCVGVTEVNYNESINSVVVYGSDPRRAGRTVGPRKMTADLKLLRREWDVVLAKLGGNFGRLKILVVVCYSVGADQPVITDTVEGYIAGVDSSNQEGTDPSSVTLTLDPTDITWNGKSLEERPTDLGASFWIQDATGIEGQDYAENLWDTVRLGGVLLPGICSVKGLPMLSFDKKKAGGVDGATITVNGYLPGPIDIECRMWTPSQWQLFVNYVAPKIWRRPNTGKTDPAKLAKDIDHPALAVWGIRSVVVLGVSVIEPAGDPGVRVVRLKCVEHVAPKKSATVTPKGSTNVPTDKHFQPASNEAGEPPSKTGIHPGGAAQSHKGGVS